MSDIERGSYAPLPEEHDFEPEEYDADEQEEAYSRGPFLFVVAVVVLAAFGGVVYVAYQQGLRQGQSMAPPVIVAETGPEKVDPVDPGGFEEPYQDTLVLNGNNEETAREENLLPPPEEPTELPTAPEESVAMLDEVPEALPEMRDVAEAPPTVSVPPAPSESAPESSEPVIVPRPDPVSSIEGAPETMEEMILSTENPAVPMPADKPEVLIPVDNVATGSVQTRPASSGSYVVQVASIPQNALAQSKLDDVAQKHAPILTDLQLEIQTADLGAKGTYYRVRVGPFASRPEAVDLCETLKARGQDCFVTKP